MSSPEVLFSIDLDRFVASSRAQAARGLEHVVSPPQVGQGRNDIPAAWTSLEVTSAAFSGSLRPAARGTTGTVTVQVTGTVAISSGVNPPNVGFTWTGLSVAPAPFTVDVSCDLVWAGKQHTTDMVGAPFEADPDEDAAHLPVPRTRTQARIFLAPHPGASLEKELEDLMPRGIRPKRLPFAVWVEEYDIPRDKNHERILQTHWVTRPDAGAEVAEAAARRLLVAAVDRILGLPVSFAQEYGHLGINAFGLVLDGRFVHVVGTRWRPWDDGGADALWGPWSGLSEAINDDQHPLPQNLGSSFRLYLAPEVFLRTVQFAFEVASLLDEVVGLVSAVDMAWAAPDLPGVPATDDRAAVPPRSAINAGFAEWLRQKLLSDGWGPAALLEGQRIVPFLELLESRLERASITYAEEYLAEVAADVWPLDTSEGLNVAVNEANVKFVSADDDPVLFPGLLPGEHAVIRARMTIDTTIVDAHVHIYFNLAIGPFLEFKARVTDHVSDPDFVWLADILMVLFDLTIQGTSGGVGIRLDLKFREFFQDLARGFLNDSVKKVPGIAERGAEEADPSELVQRLAPVDANLRSRVGAVASRHAGLRPSDLVRVPRLMLQNGAYSAKVGMTLDIDVDRGGLPAQPAGESADVYAAGDGIVGELRVFTANDSDFDGTLIEVENRWDGEDWVGATLRCALPPGRSVTFFRSESNAWASPLLYLGRDENTLRLAEAADLLTRTPDSDVLELSAASFGNTGTALWAARIRNDEDESECWTVGVSTAPRTPLTSREKARKAVAARAKADILEDLAGLQVDGEWARISIMDLAGLSGGQASEQKLASAVLDHVLPLGRFALIDPFDLTTTTPDGRTVRQVADGFALADIAGPRFAAVGTLNDQRELGAARGRIAAHLARFGDALVGAFTESLRKVDDEDDPSPEDEARSQRIQPAIDLAVAAACMSFDLEVPEDYDEHARPEHYVRSVSPRPAGRTAWLSHEALVAERADPEDIEPYRDPFSERFYLVRKRWRFSFRLASRGFPPTAVFRVRLTIDGSQLGQPAEIRSVDLDAVGVLAGGKPKVVWEIVSDQVVMNFEIPAEVFRAHEPETGRLSVRVEISEGRRSVAEDWLTLDVVERSWMEYTALGRALIDRFAGSSEAPDWGSYGLPTPGMGTPDFRVPAFAGPDSRGMQIPTNPSVDDLLGHLPAKRRLKGGRLPGPRPPSPAVDDLLGHLTGPGPMFGGPLPSIPADVLRRWRRMRLPSTIPPAPPAGANYG